MRDCANRGARTLLTGVIAVSTLCLSGMPSAALAGVSFCNRTDHPVTFAAVHPQTRGGDSGIYWEGKGWVTLPAGRCTGTALSGNYEGYDLYFRERHYLNDGTIRVDLGRFSFCGTEETNYTVRDDALTRCRPGFEPLGFFPVSIRDANAVIEIR